MFTFKFLVLLYISYPYFQTLNQNFEDSKDSFKLFSLKLIKNSTLIFKKIVNYYKKM